MVPSRVPSARHPKAKGYISFLFAIKAGFPTRALLFLPEYFVLAAQGLLVVWFALGQYLFIYTAECHASLPASSPTSIITYFVLSLS
jgi:hypothetical protein